jgi:hypothetical protein
LTRRAKISWLVLGAFFVVGLAFMARLYIQISKDTYQGLSASLQLTVAAIWHVLEFLDDHNGVMTAIATGVVAWFTFSLRQSTDKLWDAGNQQRLSSERIAAGQSADVQASIKATAEAANAAIKSNQIAVYNAEQQLRAYVTVQEVNTQTHHGPATMGAYGPVEGPVHTYRFAVILKNGGMTPAVNGKINMSYQRFNDQNAAADCHFPDSTNFADALIGPGVIWFTPSITIPASELEAPTVGAFHYLYGWIEYDDIFPGTGRHRTEFCFRIKCERLQPTNEPWISFHPHSRFNAADRDCLRPPPNRLSS